MRQKTRLDEAVGRNGPQGTSAAGRDRPNLFLPDAVTLMMKGYALALVAKLSRMIPAHDTRVRERTADRERRIDGWHAESRFHGLRYPCVVTLERPIRQLLLHDLPDFVVRRGSAVLSLGSMVCSAVVGLDGIDQEVFVAVNAAQHDSRS